MNKRLCKSDNKMICGVCGGIAEYFNIDPTVIRVIWAVTSIFAFAGAVANIKRCIVVNIGKNRICSSVNIIAIEANGQVAVDGFALGNGNILREVIVAVRQVGQAFNAIAHRLPGHICADVVMVAHSTAATDTVVAVMGVIFRFCTGRNGQ